jgi:hydrogenase maturation protein HypF
MPTFEIGIKGIVQGVGFRPLVYNLAQSKEIKGWVRNSSNGLTIRFSTSEKQAKEFYNEVITKAPRLSSITSHSFKVVDTESFGEFTINLSHVDEEPEVLLTPDYAVCNDCLLEVADPLNRRNRYAFTTCSICGPRYSILNEVPYDRENSTMSEFQMCSQCLEEYYDPSNRRFFAQTNSCQKCGIQHFWHDSSTNWEGIQCDDWLTNSLNLLNKGKILAIKGIGGFLFMADATSEQAVKELRRRKNRPSKPFALMMLNSEMLKQYVCVSGSELAEWYNETAPIVLFNTRPEHKLPKQIAPSLHELGVMRPYTPLHQILINEFNKPLIATSANLSGSPIIFRNDDIDELKEIADAVLSNNREILFAQDDSVIRLTKSSRKILLRRSRGHAPNVFQKGISPDEKLFAAGAQLKSTIGMTYRGNLLISQYIGDSDSWETQQLYSRVFDHWVSVFKPNIEVVLADRHPGYFSTQFAEKLASEKKLELQKVQHHEAHFTAVLGENELWDDRTLGIIWDGTGLGNDDHIWGGEFFLYENRNIHRVDHLPYFDHILGDKMVKEPRISLLSISSGFEELPTILSQKFTSAELNLYLKLLGQNSLKSSSMGRLFDAVSSLLNFCDKTSYHGEAAMITEASAWQNSSKIKSSYLDSSEKLIPERLIRHIIHDLKKGQSISLVSYKFHYSLVKWIEGIARKTGVTNLAFSGGVFQNKLLVELIEEELGEKFHLHFHKNLSPNDECISYGQIMHYLHISKNDIP